MVKYIAEFADAWKRLQIKYPERLERVTKFALSGQNFSMRITLDGKTIISVKEQSQRECYEKMTARIWYYLRFH